ncbi:MAG: type II toxin-antitoxin system VapC family toxin [Candidatus Sigynarchaeum springense]
MMTCNKAVVVLSALLVKKIIDSNIIIYSLLQNHPANGDCVKFLEDHDAPNVLYSLVDCLDETYWILKNVYRIDAVAIIQRLEKLINTNIIFLGLKLQDSFKAFEIQAKNSIQITDARLFLLASAQQIPVIVTDDMRFQTFNRSQGLLTETPITQDTRNKMAEWENKNLPEAGLPRILARIHAYLSGRDPKTADLFEHDTFHFSKLPGV